MGNETSTGNEAQPHSAERRPSPSKALFRSVNERIRGLSDRLDDDDLLRLVCECSDDACTAAIAVPVTVFDAVRARRGQTIVSTCHRLDEQAIAARSPHFVVVDRQPQTTDDTVADGRSG